MPDELSDKNLRRVMSVNDAMRALDCSRDRLYGLLARGELSSYLDGRRRKITVASIDGYVARRLAAAKEFERARHPVRREADAS